MAADLGAGAHRGPRIDHGSRAHVGADIDVGGHQNGARGDVGAVARHGVRHRAHAQLLVSVLEFHLVVPLQFAGAHRAHGAHREVEQDGLLDPFVHAPPAAVCGFGGAQAALVHLLDHRVDGSAHLGVGEQCAVVPRPIVRCSSSYIVSSFAFATAFSRGVAARTPSDAAPVPAKASASFFRKPKVRKNFASHPPFSRKNANFVHPSRRAALRAAGRGKSVEL